MKKCPGCRSISSDAETTCGVCGESLAEVLPKQETLEQSILEDEAQKSAEDKQLMRRASKLDARKLLVGLAVGLVVLGSGIVLVNSNGLQWGLNGTIWGLLLVPLGLWITASATLGGLGPGGPYRLGLHRVMFFWWNWIGSEEAEKGDEDEGNDGAAA